MEQDSLEKISLHDPCAKRNLSVSSNEATPVTKVRIKDDTENKDEVLAAIQSLKESF